MQKDIRELKAYENILLNLEVLKKEASQTRPQEIKAIEDIMNTLSALRDSEPNMLPLSGSLHSDSSESTRGVGHGKVLVHAK